MFSRYVVMYHLNDGYNNNVGHNMALFLVASCIDEWRNCALYSGESGR
jgi:hypothetical protein